MRKARRQKETELRPCSGVHEGRRRWTIDNLVAQNVQVCPLLRLCAGAIIQLVQPHPIERRRIAGRSKIPHENRILKEPLKGLVAAERRLDPEFGGESISMIKQLALRQSFDRGAFTAVLPLDVEHGKRAGNDPALDACLLAFCVFAVRGFDFSIIGCILRNLLQSC